MKVVPTSLKDVLLLEPQLFEDKRGYFMESYNKKTAADVGLNMDFIQDNQSLSTLAGTIRGLHFQLNPKAQTKWVRCLSGSIYDVVVDLRVGSPTYKKWTGVLLSEYNHRQLVVPKGFAHGFCTLVPNTVVSYKVDAYYDPECDSGILWNDPELKIDWPTTHPILSQKDTQQPTLSEAKLNFIYKEETDDE
ncbi:MAG: dTDP-4-dehydrorhamnose 3,5-epimerase [Defluviitaleaceae bacterium]|nr:dTDP-4-dehydrorhamnose 3,5-epimerase [Defluviitaleaceae bacterium]